MLESLRQLIAEFTSGRRPAQFADNDYRLAATALLIHVISLDGEPSEDERAKLQALLEYRFDLDAEAARELIREAAFIEGEAIDLDGFTSQINRAVSRDGRLRIIEMMWELVYADDRASEFEDSVVERAATLLGISTADQDALRETVLRGRIDP
ncbi:MAG: TerB family tellurite resistance protein [Xanthobacteraceae bacterium]|nr:MAG: TerB family tellurite resistance protein [Xanthobacteraceae bacterium]